MYVYMYSWYIDYLLVCNIVVENLCIELYQVLQECFFSYCHMPCIVCILTYIHTCADSECAPDVSANPAATQREDFVQTQQRAAAYSSNPVSQRKHTSYIHTYILKLHINRVSHNGFPSKLFQARQLVSCRRNGEIT